jgi:hypothetical protein
VPALHILTTERVEIFDYTNISTNKALLPTVPVFSADVSLMVLVWSPLWSPLPTRNAGRCTLDRQRTLHRIALGESRIIRCRTLRMLMP